MTRHLGYSLIGGLLFLVVTLVVLRFSDTGIHEGLMEAISGSLVFQNSIRASLWIGVLTGGVSSIVLRKSINQKVYVWIIIVFILVITEFVIMTLI